MQRAKGGWTSAGERGNIEARKEYGLGTRQLTPQERNINAAIAAQVHDKRSDTLVDAIVENHEALRYYTPENMKVLLETAGYEVKPLGHGNYKGVPFEDGGGYRVNFGGDGILHYHPEKRSHHGGAYWKIQNGKEAHRYGLDGSEK